MTNEWEGQPMVFVTIPACPHCGSFKRATIRSERNGDGSRTRKTICRKCKGKYLLIAEPPLPDSGSGGEGEC